MTRPQRWLMVAVILGSGIVFLDSTVVALALTRLADELPRIFLGRLEGQAYVFGFYLVALSSLLIVAGALNDRIGRKRMFAVGLTGFGITSVLCGLAWNMESLILFRILQGAAGAILVPGSLSLITVNFEGEQQGRAFGIWAAASGATTILGPVLGGVLVDTVSWRAAFFINVPLIALALYATFRHVPESRDETATGRLDWVGSILAVLAVGGLAFGAIRGEQTQFATPTPFVSLAVGLAALVALPIWLRRARDPLVPLQLFRSRNFTVTNVSTFVIYGALYVTFAFLPIFLTGTLGYTAAGAGVAILSADVFLVLFSTRFGALAGRLGPRAFMAVGPAIMGLGLLLLARVPADSAPWRLGSGEGTFLPPSDFAAHLLPGLLVFGVGLTVMVAPLTTALMTSIPPRHSGVASAINNAISRIGSPLVSAAIFIAISASFYGVIAERVPEAPVESPRFREVVAPLNPVDPGGAPSALRPVVEEVRPIAPAASTDGFHLAMYVAAGLMLAGAAVNGIGIRNTSTADAVEGGPPREGGERVDRIPEGVPCLPVPQPTGLPSDRTAGPG